MKRLAPIAAALLSLLLYVVVFAQDFEGTVNKGANLRSGPGTTYAIVGKATQGEAVTITDKNAAGDWYQLDTGEWIAAFLVTLDATPIATATPTVHVTQADILNDPVAQAYINGVSEALQLFSSGTTTVADRFRAASANPSVMLTGRWKLAVIEGLAKVQVSSNSIRSLDPPAYFFDIHNDLLSVADHSDNSVSLIADGMDNMNFDQMGEGANEITLASEFLASAQVKIEALVAAASATSTPSPTKTPTPRPTTTTAPVPTATPKG